MRTGQGAQRPRPPDAWGMPNSGAIATPQGIIKPVADCCRLFQGKTLKISDIVTFLLDRSNIADIMVIWLRFSIFS